MHNFITDKTLQQGLESESYECIVAYNFYIQQCKKEGSYMFSFLVFHNYLKAFTVTCLGEI